MQRRLRRLEANGVIQANVAIVDPARVGRAITLIVEIEIANERLDALDAIKRAFAADPDVQQCYYVTGETDFILIVNVGSMADYETLAKRLFFANDNVQRFRTFVTMDRVKVSLSLAVE